MADGLNYLINFKWDLEGDELDLFILPETELIALTALWQANIEGYN